MRERLIEQGVNLPQITKSEYNLSEQFDTFSRHTGHCKSTVGTKSGRDLIIDASIDDKTLVSHQPSTIYSDDTPLATKPVGCNDDHEGMNYQRLLNSEEKAEYLPFDPDPSFQECKCTYYRILFIHKILTLFIVPDIVTRIYPRAECDQDRFTDEQINDFNQELLRTRDLADAIPPPNHDRALDEVTRRLTSDQRRSFFYQGNALLVMIKLCIGFMTRGLNTPILNSRNALQTSMYWLLLNHMLVTSFNLRVSISYVFHFSSAKMQFSSEMNNMAITAIIT